MTVQARMVMLTYYLVECLVVAAKTSRRGDTTGVSAVRTLNWLVDQVGRSQKAGLLVGSLVRWLLDATSMASRAIETDVLGARMLR